jgi:hypothetical protein
MSASGVGLSRFVTAVPPEESYQAYEGWFNRIEDWAGPRTVRWSFRVVLELVGERPTATEVPILDRDGHDTPGWDRLVIEQIVQVRFLGRAVTGTERTIGTLGRHGLRIDWLGQDVGIQILRLHEKALPSHSTRRVGWEQPILGAVAGRSRPDRPLSPAAMRTTVRTPAGFSSLLLGLDDPD